MAKLGALAVLALLPGPAALARESEPEGPAKVGGASRALRSLRDGEAAWYLLVGLSAGSTMLALDLAWRLRRERFLPGPTVADLEAEARSGRRDGLRRLANEAAGDCLIARVVLAGVERLRGDEADANGARAAAEAEGEAEFGRLDRRAAILAALGTAAGLLGLIATVQALIDGCRDFAGTTEGPGAPGLAAIVARSLVPTVWGLAIALIASLLVALLRIRLDALADEVGRRAVAILWPPASSR